MESLELLDLIELGETSTVQFKRTLDNVDKVAAEMCAFANSEGGRILFGVEDDGTISGLSFDEVRDLNSRIATIASDKVREPIFPSSEVVKVEGRNVLVVEIRKSQSKPHFDNNGAIWVKTMGDKRRVTSREELRRIFQETDVFTADEQPIRRSSIHDLDRETFREYYERVYEETLDTESAPLTTLLQNLNIAKGEHLTLAGLLFFGINPRRFRPELVTKAVAFPGTEVTDIRYLDSEDMDGTLPQQLAKAKAFLKRNLVKRQGDRSFNTEGISEIPAEALEELLVNMYVHRNYFVSAPQTVLVFVDRVELHSPGTLPNALTVDQVKMGNSIARNPILLGFASRLLPYRGIGTGVMRALRLYPRIQFFAETDANRFRVVIERSEG